MCVLIKFEHFLPFHLIYSFVREKSGEKNIYHISSLLLPLWRGGRGRGETNKNLGASSAINCVFSSKKHLLMNVNLYHCFSVNIFVGIGQSIQRWVSPFNPCRVELNIIYTALEGQKQV